MWRNWSEEWERRKSYLVRSLFEDIPILSPIPETYEPRSNEYSPSSPKPDSPLPDLIIEKEKNYHDEPEEFYQILEEKMLILYKKLFYGINDEFNSDDSRNANFNNEISKDSSFSTTFHYDATSKIIPDNKSSSNDDSDDISQDSNRKSETSTEIHQSNTPAESISPEQHTHEIVITQAIVHREDIAEEQEDMNNNILSENYLTSPTYTNTSPILVTSRLGMKRLQQYKDMQEVQIPDRLEEKQASNVQDLSSGSKEADTENISEIETVRRNESESISPSSIPGKRVSSEDSLTPVKEIEREMSYIDDITQSDVMVESMPGTEHAGNSSKTQKHPTKRVSLDSQSLISEEYPNKKKYKTISIQTSPIEDTRVTWEDLRANLFQGSPLIYNLCHCRNHVCE